MLFRGFILFLAFFIVSDTATVRFSYIEKAHFTWHDFTGKPDKTSPYAASVNTGISQSFITTEKGELIKDSVKITAYFYPKLSWYKPDYVTPLLLEHERNHFAISEIHARILRDKIRGFPFSFRAGEQIDSLYRTVEKARILMQSQYDLETSHSRNENAEKQWQQTINNKMDVLGE